MFCGLIGLSDIAFLENPDILQAKDFFLIIRIRLYHSDIFYILFS